MENARRDEVMGLTWLESDPVFIYRHCTRLTPEETLQRSPVVVNSPGWGRFAFFTCEFFVDGRFCKLDLEGLPKPKICKGYPWYNDPRRYDKWYHPGCGYAPETVKNMETKG